MSWAEVSASRKEEIRSKIREILSPLISLEYFESALLANNYKYADFVMAYRNWVLKAKKSVDRGNHSNRVVPRLNELPDPKEYTISKEW